MTSTASRTEYTRRMHRVLDHIDQHLDRALELGELAEVAHFSAFHFHRLFSVWMGETLGDYLRRRRLEVAAMRLAAQPRLPVLSVALSVGFGSAEAFARAFRSRFGCTATAWRRQEAQRRAGRRLAAADSNPGQALRKPDQEAQPHRLDHEGSIRSAEELVMKVKLIERQPVKVAYLRHIGPYGPALSGFWQKVVYPWIASNDWLDRPRYGISYDDPAISAPEKCRYDACVEVPQDFMPTGQSLVTTIPGGRYAMSGFSGPMAGIGEAWDALLRDWLPASGLQLDARPCFEYYAPGAGYDARTGLFSFDIVIPVVPL